MDARVVAFVIVQQEQKALKKVNKQFSASLNLIHTLFSWSNVHIIGKITL